MLAAVGSLRLEYSEPLNIREVGRVCEAGGH